jgi:putative ABC transport system permease protein
VKLYNIVVKDVLRRKKRVAYATLGVVIGIMTVVGILTVSLAGQTKLVAQLEKYGPNLSVVPAINSQNIQLGNITMGTLSVGENYIPEERLSQIQKIADGSIRDALKLADDGIPIATIAPTLYVNTTVKGTTMMVVGIHPEAEWKIRTWWNMRKGEFLERTDQAVIGSQAAQLLGIKVGDTIDLDGSQAQVQVSGILDETGANEDYQLFVTLEKLQKAVKKEGLVSSINIRALCNACPVEYIADEINKEIPGVRAVAVKQVAATELEMQQKIGKFMLALAGITLAIGLFGVINTMMASVNERIKDIGIMRAVGASQKQITRIFIYEAVIIGLFGGVFGYLAGTLLAYGIGPIIFEGTPISFVAQYIPVSLVLATLISVLATLYPAYRATKIKVADSFRAL